MTKPRYKDRSMQKVYESLLELAADPKSELYRSDGTPRSGANVRNAFWAGYRRTAALMLSPGTMLWVAYQAGKEFALRSASAP